MSRPKISENEKEFKRILKKVIKKYEEEDKQMKNSK